MEEEEEKQPDEEKEIPNEESEKKIRICPCCKQEYKIKVGINNWKNLFRKPTLDDWITLFILIMLILASYAYIQETKACKEMVSNLDETCSKYDAWRFNLTKDETSVDNLLVMPIIKNQSNSTEVIGGEVNESGDVNITASNYSNASN